MMSWLKNIITGNEINTENDQIKKLGIKARKNPDHFFIECEKGNCIFFRRSLQNYLKDANFAKKNGTKMEDICENSFVPCCDRASKKKKTGWGGKIRVRYGKNNRLVTCRCPDGKSKSKNRCLRCRGFKKMTLYDYCKLNIQKEELERLHKDSVQVIHPAPLRDCRNKKDCAIDYRAYKPFGDRDLGKPYTDNPNTDDPDEPDDKKDEISIRMTPLQRVDALSAEIDLLKKEYVDAKTTQQRDEINNEIRRKEEQLARMEKSLNRMQKLDAGIEELKRGIEELEEEIKKAHTESEDMNKGLEERKKASFKREQKQEELGWKKQELSDKEEQRQELINSLEDVPVYEEEEEEDDEDGKSEYPIIGIGIGLIILCICITIIIIFLVIRLSS